MKAREFLEKYVALCRESGFCLVSDDPYEPIVLSRLNLDSSNPDEVIDGCWIDYIISDYE